MRVDPKRNRERMVREQIEARGVQDPAVLEAMRAVPRHLFMEEALASQAYDDRPQPIGHGQTISQPYVVAWMTALLEILPGMRVLEIGTGSGYQAAVLAEVGAEVFSVERIKKLFMETRDRLMKMRYFGIKLKLDDGTLGWPEEAPFDRIIVTAGGPEVPKPLLEQLADPGRLVIPVGTSRRYQRMVVVEKKDGRMNERDLGPVSFVDLIGAHGWQPARAQEGGNMAGKERMSLARAWKRSPGPDTPREALVLGLKGVCMGVADIIPGVSGGTMALITGIYDQLISAVKSFDAKALGRIAALDFPGALARVHARFLAFLLTGIALALLSMARVIHFLLEAYPVQVWALFFGLILASVLVVLRRVERFGVPELLFTGAGAVISWLVVGLIPVQTPETPAFIFFSGCLAICAMILPGISGAFILLILGKYQFITGTLKNPFLPENLAIIGVFAAGCVAGVTLFSRVLDFFLKRFHAATISLLAGFMIGALRKVWPWKEVLETVTVRGKTMVVSEANVWPPDLGAGFWIALGLAVLGIVLVLILERASADRRI